MNPICTNLAEHRQLLEALESEGFGVRLLGAADLLEDCLRRAGVILVCGNGGSAADAQHIVGEFVGKFLRTRPAINAVCLSSNSSVLTAWGNDIDFETVFSRQVEAFAGTPFCLVALSTSGNSPNVVAAAQTARRLGGKVVSLTGEGGGRLAAHTDILLDVPSRSTPRIQELHIVVYHWLCEEIERRRSSTA